MFICLILFFIIKLYFSEILKTKTAEIMFAKIIKSDWQDRANARWRCGRVKVTLATPSGNCATTSSTSWWTTRRGRNWLSCTWRRWTTRRRPTATRSWYWSTHSTTSTIRDTPKSGGCLIVWIYICFQGSVELAGQRFTTKSRVWRMIIFFVRRNVRCLRLFLSNILTY